MSLLGFLEIKSKLEQYCAYQERSIYEVNKKTRAYTDDVKIINQVQSSLLSDGFLNQGRFVDSYIQGKMNQKRWGKQKIKSGLIQHKVPIELIDRGLKAVPQEIHKANVLILAEKKARSLKKDENPYEKKSKMLRFLASKGYTLSDCEGLDFDLLFAP